MIRRTIAAAAVGLLVPLCAVAQASRSGQRQLIPVVPAGTLARTNGAVTRQDIAAVLLAIKDEMYAGGCASMLADIGRPAGHGQRQINVYFQPKLTEGISSVIYKFWPFGEVNRSYWIDTGGLAHLMGHPTWGFPPTESSYLTIYMGDQELSRAKSKWRRVPLDIRLSPTAGRVHQAERRQEKRGGDIHVCRGRWQGNIFIPQQ